MFIRVHALSSTKLVNPLQWAKYQSNFRANARKFAMERWSKTNGNPRWSSKYKCPTGYFDDYEVLMYFDHKHTINVNILYFISQTNRILRYWSIAIWYCDKVYGCLWMFMASTDRSSCWNTWNSHCCQHRPWAKLDVTTKESSCNTTSCCWKLKFACFRVRFAHFCDGFHFPSSPDDDISHSHCHIGWSTQCKAHLSREEFVSTCLPSGKLT